MPNNRPMNSAWPSNEFPGYGAGYAAGYGGFNQYQHPQGGYNKRPPFNAAAGFSNSRRSGGGREMIQYKDLDAPDDN